MAQQEFNDFEVQVDLQDVNAWGGEYAKCPPGDYPFNVVHVEKRPAKSSGNEMIVVTCQVDDGQLDADGNDITGAKIWANYSLSPAALGRLKSLMVACGCSLGKFQASELMGARFMGTVIQTQGAQMPDANGNLMEAKVFSNIVNERPIEETKPEPKAAAKAPPITQKAAPATKPAAVNNGAARRA